MFDLAKMLHELFEALKEYGAGGLLAGVGVSWAVFMHLRAERLVREHNKAMEELRREHESQRSKDRNELKRTQGDVLKLIGEYAQLRALQKETDGLHTATLKEVMDALSSPKEGGKP